MEEYPKFSAQSIELIICYTFMRNYCYTLTMKEIIAADTYDFKEVKENYIYVDKTQYLYKLIVEYRKKLVFVSRPRRFGKSLTVSTLEYLFSGDKEVFKGTWIYNSDYDFKKYPVIHIDFVNCSAESVQELNRWLNSAINKIASKYSITIPSDCEKPYEAFNYLIDKVVEIDNVVVLIDEYDRPITHNLHNPEAENIRKALSNFFQCLKRNDIRFLFITGVSKFSKLSLFSTLNNFTDITYDEPYATMFGYTQDELEANFAEYIDEGITKTGYTREDYLDRLKKQYYGYKFYDRAETVYNPVSVGFFFSKGGERFDNYWSETGMSTLIYDVAKKTDFSVIDDVSSTPITLDFSTFDILKLTKSNVSKPDLMKLMLQTGYLTIKSGYPRVYLDFPNLEVSNTFNAGSV